MLRDLLKNNTENPMKNFLNTNKYILTGVVVGSLAIIVFSNGIVNKRLAEYRQGAEYQIKSTETELNDMLDVVAKGKSNEFAKRVAQDCTSGERAIFDSKLAKLDSGLSKQELNELDVLFSKCAAIDAVYRSAMVLQLRNLISSLKLQISQRKILGRYENYDEKLVQYELLLSQEETISELSFSLVTLQGEIIESLIKGLSVDSDEANQLKSKGQSLRNELTQLVLETAKAREYIKESKD